MTSASRGPSGPAATLDLIRELRTYTAEAERYIAQMGHVHTLHRTDLSAIGFVMDHGGATPTEISEGLRLSPSATSAMLDRLERVGHVRRERAESDRRSVHVVITDQALDVGSSMFGLLAKHMRAVLDTYDQDELARMATLMHRLNDATRAASEEAAAGTTQ
jgi:DNA-binding MarR family transcriptional regulator